MIHEKKYVYSLTIAYEGTRYAGWQVQPNALSIQALLEEKLSCLLKSPHTITGSGRTDAGVHAIQQVAHFTTSTPIETDRIMRSLNGMLPFDIRITSLSHVPSHFHARKSALAKEYHYSIITGPFILPQNSRYTWHIFQPLDIEKIEKALPYFIGTHDFFSYANENSRGAAAKNSIRTIYDLRLIHEPYIARSNSIQQQIRLEFYGSGFLYKMVRNITGMLVAIGLGKRSLLDVEESFEKRERSFVDRAAPAHGLTLLRVEYPLEFHQSETESSPLFEYKNS